MIFCQGNFYTVVIFEGNKMKLSITLYLVAQMLKDILSLECYTCENEQSNIHCVGDYNVVECEEGFDTCQTIVAYSDVSEKLSIIKTCTKNQSCILQMYEHIEEPCDVTQDNWICTDCCHSDRCNINSSGKPFADIQIIAILCSFNVILNSFSIFSLPQISFVRV